MIGSSLSRQMLLSNSLTHLYISLIIGFLAFILFLWKNSWPWNYFPELAMAFLMPNKRGEGVLRQGRKSKLKPASELGALALSWNSTEQVQH